MSRRLPHIRAILILSLVTQVHLNLPADEFADLLTKIEKYEDLFSRCIIEYSVSHQTSGQENDVTTEDLTVHKYYRLGNMIRHETEYVRNYGGGQKNHQWNDWQVFDGKETTRWTFSQKDRAGKVVSSDVPPTSGSNLFLKAFDISNKNGLTLTREDSKIIAVWPERGIWPLGERIWEIHFEEFNGLCRPILIRRQTRIETTGNISKVEYYCSYGNATKQTKTHYFPNYLINDQALATEITIENVDFDPDIDESTFQLSLRRDTLIYDKVARDFHRNDLFGWGKRKIVNTYKRIFGLYRE